MSEIEELTGRLEQRIAILEKALDQEELVKKAKETLLRDDHTQEEHNAAKLVLSDTDYFAVKMTVFCRFMQMRRFSDYNVIRYIKSSHEKSDNHYNKFPITQELSAFIKSLEEFEK